MTLVRIWVNQVPTLKNVGDSMCGVWGRITLNREISFEELLHPVKMLAHRGPDSYAWYSNPRAALLHTRLSIIDVGGGTQPIESFDGRFVGIVNGELYDYEIHRTRLKSLGVTFKTNSDSEVLLNLFAREGVSSLGQLSGEFAFVFYDRELHKFFFGRDPHGVKPLFYQKTDESFTLASEVKALSSTPQELDEIYLKRYLSKLMIPPRTAIKGAFHVLPAFLHEYDPKSGEIISQSYYKLPLGSERILKGQEAIEKVRFELMQSVKRRIIADVEVGCYLSGGIDSALIAALMVENGANPKAFTVGFAEADFDETLKAKKIANHLGIQHLTTELNRKNFMGALNSSIVAFENPISNPHGAAKNLLSSLASKSVKVVLSGEGADEWFGGYAYLRAQKLMRFLESHPSRKARALQLFLQKEKGVGAGHLDGHSTRHAELVGSFFGGKIPALFSRVNGHRAVTFCTGEDSTSFLTSALTEMQTYLTSELDYRALEDFDLNTWVSLRTDFMHYIISNLGDRQEMANSVEGRTPFLDPAVTRIASRLNKNTLLRGLTEKSPLKLIAKDYLSLESSREKKHAFFAPMQYFLLRENREEVDAAIEICRQACPGLPWKNIESVLGRRKHVTDYMKNLSVSFRIQLYSAGVLVRDLHKPLLANPHGYKVPQTVSELMSSRVLN